MYFRSSLSKLCLFLIIFITISLKVQKTSPVHAEVQVDSLCNILFQQYIVHSLKGGTDDVSAAIHLIASRGYKNGFWKVVYAELKKNNERSEIGCVRILGIMLGYDAYARKYKCDDGEPTQQEICVRLGPEVFTELIKRTQKHKDSRIDNYIIALVRANDIRTKKVFLEMLKSGDVDESVKFHAAVGLAEMGESIGIEWLIENIENSTSTVCCAWPYGVPDFNLNTCCAFALKSLTGKIFKTQSEWLNWQRTINGQFKPKGHVRLMDP